MLVYGVSDGARKARVSGGKSGRPGCTSPPEFKPIFCSHRVAGTMFLATFERRNLFQNRALPGRCRAAGPSKNGFAALSRATRADQSCRRKKSSSDDRTEELSLVMMNLPLQKSSHPSSAAKLVGSGAALVPVATARAFGAVWFAVGVFVDGVRGAGLLLAD